MDRHADVLARFEARGGYRVEAEIHKILAGLGFRQDDLTKRTDQFSGGWRTRIALAKLLVRSPTCCCSTSRPTTWTWKRPSGWRGTSRRPVPRRSSSRTTATSWIG